MIHLRCSRLPLFFACSQSAAPGISVESPDREPADMGTAEHEMLTQWIAAEEAGNPFDIIESVDAVAARLSLDAAELTKRVYIAKSLWNQAAGYFPHPVVGGEMRFEDPENGLVLTGTPDIYCPPEAIGLPEVRGADFKTGRLHGDHEHQLKGYGFLLFDRYPEAERYWAPIIRTREGTMDGRYWTRLELWGWYTELLERIRDTTYRPGRHCAWCSRGATCEAKTALLEQCAALVRPQQLVNGPRDSVERARWLENVLVAAKMAAKAAEDATELVCAEVIAAGGQLGDLHLVPQERRKVVFPAALPVLRDELGADLDQILSASKGAIEEAVKAKAPRGGKGAAVKAVLDRLDQAGAIEINVIESLEIRARKEIEVSNVESQPAGTAGQ